MNQEEPKNSKDSMLNRLSTLIFYFCLFAFIVALAFPHNPPAGNWYQQFMPFLNNRPLKDITFIDSLNGFAVTGDNTPGDTNYILKTTNGGDNWNIINSVYRDLTRLTFINQNTGFVCGGFNVVGGYLIKTTNAGLNWDIIPNSNFANHFEWIFTFGADTIFVVDDNGLNGGVFRTTNGGINWQTMYGGPEGPNKIYMFNSRIGFFSTNFKTFKTTNSGFNWSEIDVKGFRDIYFADSLTGWKTRGDTMQATTNGGLNWTRQILPYGGMLFSPVMIQFDNINKDTIWGIGGYISYPNNQVRAVLYRTVNGGVNWLFQVPDTNINIAYEHIKFWQTRNGWVYSSINPKGIHTTNGGDTTFYLAIQQTSNNIPKDFELKQNYPNPFNPRTVIPYKLKNAAFVRVAAYEVTGKETQIMVNQHQQAGEYEVDFIGKFTISSGVYFYRIEVTDDRSKQLYKETKKMILLK